LKKENKKWVLKLFDEKILINYQKLFYDLKKQTKQEDD